MGAPSMNFIDTTYDKNALSFEGTDTAIQLNKKQSDALEKYLSEFDEEKRKSVKFVYGIRPEDIVLSDKGEEVKITLIEMLGCEYIVHFLFGGKDFTIKLPSKSEVDGLETIKIEFTNSMSHLFDKDSEKAIY